MKALQLTPGGLTYRTDYPQPQGDDAIIRVVLAGICGTDMELLAGYRGFSGIIGHEFVGVVESCGNPEWLGKRVVAELNFGCGTCDMCLENIPAHCHRRAALGIFGADGVFAEYVQVPASVLHEVPANLTDRQAVFVEPLAAAYEIIQQVNPAPSTQTAIVGDGRLAQLAARVLFAEGCEVTVFGRHESKLARLRALGIATSSVAEAPAQSYALVVEASGRAGGFADAMTLVRPRGTVVLKSTMAAPEGVDLTPVVINEITVIGSRCGPFKRALDALTAGGMVVEDLLDEVYPLREFERAFTRARSPATVKVCFDPAL